jgi:hypothetical protein
VLRRPRRVRPSSSCGRCATFVGVANESTARLHFESLELAIAAWGKWSSEPWRVDEARAALDRLIEIKGPPIPFPARPGSTPYYTLARSGQYVSVTWEGGAGFNVQSGFMQAIAQLGPEWVPAERDVPESQQGKWFIRAFPNNVQFGKAAEKSSARTAECTNNCSPGEKQPIGSSCPYCEKAIVAE